MVTAWLVICVMCLVIYVAISVWGTERSVQTVSFDSTLQRVEFAPADAIWTLSMPAVTKVEVAGCQLPLKNLHGLFTNNASLHQDVAFSESAALTPASGVVMAVNLEGFQTLQAERHSSRMGLSHAKGIGGPGLRVDFAGEGTNALLLLADQFWIPLESGLQWTGVQPPPAADRVELVGATRGLAVNCASVPNFAADRPSLTFIKPGGGVTPTEIETGLSVINPLLERPRGAVTIGNREVKLYGGGSLQIRSATHFEVARLRWAPDSPSLEVSLGGRSNDVRLDDEPLVRSVLAELADEPRWTTFAAVLAVVLGAIFGKLVEIGIPTK